MTSQTQRLQPSSDDIAKAAARYVGARYVDYGRDEDALDCAGLIVRACTDCGIKIEDIDHVYHRSPHSQEILGVLRCQMNEIPVKDARHGDILCMWSDRVTKNAQHLVILYDRGKLGMGFVHAWDRVGKVSMGCLTPFWKKRVIAAFRPRGVV